jgi:hypothetical protein
VDSAGFEKLPEFPPKTNTINCADTKVLLLVEDQETSSNEQLAFVACRLRAGGKL